MAIYEIRESVSINEGVTDVNGVMYVEKVINLHSGKRHTVNAIDVFIDNLFLSASLEDYYGEVLLTSQPLLLTRQNANPFNTGEATPPVSQDTVLYKMQFRLDKGQAQILQEFPNNFLGSMPTFSWYSPRMYMYVIIYTERDNITIEDLSVSAYVAVDSRKAAFLPYMLGNLRERSNAMLPRLLSSGRLIQTPRITGQYFPMYLYGGARSQLMAKSSNIANFFYQLDPQSSESMLSTQDQRSFVAASRAMVPFDAPFGSDVGGGLGNAPDWFSSVALTGIVAGPVRDQFPPLKFNDNGNVRML